MIKTNLVIGGKSNIVATALLRANAAWADLFERDNLKAGTVLIHPGVRPSLAYFPVDGIVSVLVSPSGDPQKAEIQSAMCGDEDIAGVPALLSDAVSTYRVVVDLDTPGWRVSTQAARRLLDECAASRRIVGSYAELALTEAWQMMASAAEHSVGDRLIAYLLRAADIAHEKSLPFTQPFLADRLGVRRPSVTDLLKAMEADGLISRERARIKLLNMNALLANQAKSWPTMSDHRKAYRAEMLRV